MTDDALPAAVRVWDLPIRLFHWALAVCVTAAVVTAKIGGNAMQWHFWLGYTIFALLVFRLLWGFAGGRWSRFASFAYGPAAVWRFLRRAPRPDDRFDVGHSPLGALSVFALLAALAAQVATGLVSFDEILQVGGPLNRFVSESSAGQALGYHKAVGQWLVLSLVALHVGAVLFYLLARRRNLVAPMWHGNKPLADSALAAADSAALRLRALVLVGISMGLVTWVITLGP